MNYIFYIVLTEEEDGNDKEERECNSYRGVTFLSPGKGVRKGFR